MTEPTPTAQEAAEPAGETVRGIAVNALVAALVVLAALAPVAYFASRNIPLPIATIDLQKLVEEDQDEAYRKYSSSGMTDEQRASMEKRAVTFAQQLSTQITALAAECGCVLVNKAALLGGNTVDYTDLVRQRTKG